MNTIEHFLAENWQRLQLQRYGSAAGLSTVVVTPRFRASAHLLFFVLAKNQSSPFLVAKVPRITGDNSRLDCEFENLKAVQSARPAGFDSIPRVLAYEDYRANRVLVQTALVNQTMRPSVVRRKGAACVAKVLEWLLDLHTTTADRTEDSEVSFDRLVAEPLDYFERVFPANASESELISKTRRLADSLSGDALPTVFEHGDLSSPNILMDNRGKVGVVDWELAESKGLPAVDLFFFLTYVAFALSNAKKTAQYLAAFESCFFGSDAWAIPHIVSYREALDLCPSLLRPLFVLCWARYVTGLALRLQEHNGLEKLPKESADWLRSNRYFALWQHAVKKIDRIAFG